MLINKDIMLFLWKRKKMKTTITRTCGDAAKAVLRGKFITMSAYI
jgi:hypothetical protein